MKYVIDFFESLKLNIVNYGIEENIKTSNIEFELPDEQITVSLGKDCYYFMFTKMQSKWRSNLCSEILLLNESQYDIKLPQGNTDLNKYFAEKFHIKIIDKNNINIIDKKFIHQLENKLLIFDNLSKSLLKCKIENNLPQKNIQLKKIKI